MLCITGNGLKTTDVLTGEYETEAPIPPKIVEFDRYLESRLEVREKDWPATVEV